MSLRVLVSSARPSVGALPRSCAMHLWGRSGGSLESDKLEAPTLESGLGLLEFFPHQSRVPTFQEWRPRLAKCQPWFLT